MEGPELLNVTKDKDGCWGYELSYVITWGVSWPTGETLPSKKDCAPRI